MLSKNVALKQFNDNYSDLKESEKQSFARICNKFLQVNFITRKKIRDANDYRFVLAYREAFNSFFNLIDFSLNIERQDEVVYIKNESVFNHLKLRKDQSLLLLVIRVLYHGKRDFITLDDNVEIYLSEVHDELARIGYLDNKRITKDRLKPALSLLRQYNIIDYVDNNLRDDTRIKIYPTVVYATNLETIKDVVDRIDEYTNGEGVETEDEEIIED